MQGETPRRTTAAAGVLAIYDAYPKHAAKVDALKAIGAAVASGHAVADLLERTQAYAAAVASCSAL